LNNLFRHIIPHFLLLRIIFFLLILIWVFGFSLPFFIPIDQQTIILYQFFHKIYSGVCHQLEYKSISVFGYYFHVCARCSGIYIGAFIGSIISLFYLKQKHLKIKYFYIAAFPIIIDVLFQSLNISEYIKLSAFLTGIIFGFTVFIFFISAIENYFIVHKTNYSLNEFK